MAPTIAEIQRTVAERCGVTVIDLRSSRRDREIIVPRHVAMWVARRTTEHSLPAIARAFHRSDHSTVMHAIRNVDRWMQEDARLFRIVMEIMDELLADQPLQKQPILRIVA